MILTDLGKVFNRIHLERFVIKSLFDFLIHSKMFGKWSIVFVSYIRNEFNFLIETFLFAVWIFKRPTDLFLSKELFDLPLWSQTISSGYYPLIKKWSERKCFSVSIFNILYSFCLSLLPINPTHWPRSQISCCCCCYSFHRRILCLRFIYCIHLNFCTN